MIPIVILRDNTPAEDAAYIMAIVIAPIGVTNPQALDFIKETKAKFTGDDWDDEKFLHALNDLGFTFAHFDTIEI